MWTWLFIHILILFYYSFFTLFILYYDNNIQESLKQENEELKRKIEELQAKLDEATNQVFILFLDMFYSTTILFYSFITLLIYYKIALFIL